MAARPGRRSDTVASPVEGTVRLEARSKAYREGKRKWRSHPQGGIVYVMEETGGTDEI